MPSADLCAKDEIIHLVKWFYEGIRKGKVLGPIVNQPVRDRDRHRSTLVDVWSSPLRGSTRFCCAPMPNHMALPSRDADKLAGVA